MVGAGFTARVGGWGPCWSEWVGNEEIGNARTGVERQDAVQAVFGRHQEDREVMDGCRYSRGRSVVFGR